MFFSGKWPPGDAASATAPAVVRTTGKEANEGVASKGTCPSDGAGAGEEATAEGKTPEIGAEPPEVCAEAVEASRASCSSVSIARIFLCPAVR